MYQETYRTKVIPGKKSSYEYETPESTYDYSANNSLEMNTPSYSAEDLGVDLGMLNTEMNFGDTNLSFIQKAFLETQKELELVDGERYVGKLIDIKVGETSKSKVPTIDFIYELSECDKSVVVYDTYVFDSNNSKYLYMTVKKLKRSMKAFNYNLDIKNVFDTASIVNTCFCLIGKYVSIEQYSFNNFKKYNIYAL